jgi:hypothetical protein
MNRYKFNQMSLNLANHVGHSLLLETSNRDTLVLVCSDCPMGKKPFYDLGVSARELAEFLPEEKKESIPKGLELQREVHANSI